MVLRPVLILLVLIILSSCSKDKPLYEPKPKVDPYKIYNEGYNAFKKNDFFLLALSYMWFTEKQARSALPFIDYEVCKVNIILV